MQDTNLLEMDMSFEHKKEVGKEPQILQMVMLLSTYDKAGHPLSMEVYPGADPGMK